MWWNSTKKRNSFVRKCVTLGEKSEAAAVEAVHEGAGGLQKIDMSCGFLFLPKLLTSETIHFEA